MKQQEQTAIYLLLKGLSEVVFIYEQGNSFVKKTYKLNPNKYKEGYIILISNNESNINMLY